MVRRSGGWKVRRFRGGGLMVLSAYCLAAAGVVSAADDPSLNGDKAELQVLRARLEKLEGKVAAQEAVASSASSSSGSSSLQLPSGLQGVQMSGFVDVSGGYNVNRPKGLKNTLRVFDTESQSFLINNAEINLQKPVSADSPFGFKTSLMLGTDAMVVGGVTTGLGINGPPAEHIELKDAYGEYLVPVGEGIDVMVGKFATLNGAEVIESMNDWNFSRSFMFGFAIPFTHTGVRVTYPWTKWLSTTIGVVNGWDVVKDNNQVKTLESSVTFTPNDKVSLTTNYYVGGEQANVGGGGLGSNSHIRNLIDVVASYQPIDPLQFKLNMDYGIENKGVGRGKSASWIGLAGYARYALTPWWAVATRAEWFHDADGVRTVFRPVGTFGVGNINGISGLDLNLWEMTLTNEFKLNKHLISRLEYRHDQANERIFSRGNSRNVPYQDTLGVEFIAPF